MEEVVLPSQKEFQDHAEEIFKKDGYLAMLDYLFSICVKGRYILPERLALNIIHEPFSEERFKQKFQITINRSKPEIIQPIKKGEAAPAPPPTPTTTGPTFAGKCIICYENVASNFKPALRAFEFKLNGRDFFLQFPPFPYFEKHSCIVEKEHTPQIIGLVTIQDLLELCTMMPGYAVGSNTDKLGTGATNLEHRHYQAGYYDFPIFLAGVHRTWQHEGATIEWLIHPCTPLRVSGTREQVEKVAHLLLQGWRSGKIPGLIQDLQTISWISRLEKRHVGDKEENVYTVTMIPRNGENPRFLTRPSIQAIKKEFLGVFEMVGYAILPGRLAEELPALAKELEEEVTKGNSAFLEGGSPNLEGELGKFNSWVTEYVVPKIPEAERKEKKVNFTNAINRGLEVSFLTMVQDNCPIPFLDETLVNCWLEASGVNTSQ